jgi:hypothetical protein
MKAGVTFECLDQSLWNLVCISWHVGPPQRRTSQIPPISLCVCTCIPPIVARQRLGKILSLLNIATKRLGKHVLAAKSGHKNIRIVVRVYLWACLCIPLSLFWKNSAKGYRGNEELLEASFLCGEHLIKRKQMISSSENLFVVVLFGMSFYNIYYASHIFDWDISTHVFSIKRAHFLMLIVFNSVKSLIKLTDFLILKETRCYVPWES